MRCDIFFPQLTLTEQFEGALLLFFTELRRPVDVVGSLLQSCPLVEPFKQDQPLSEFFIRRLREESIEIVLTKMTDDLPAAISRHTYISGSIL